MQFLDFKSILTEIGQTSPLNLMAIFLKRLNLVLDRNLDWIIRIAVEVVLRRRKLRIHSTFVKVDVIYTQIWWWCGGFGWRPGFDIPQS